MGGASRAAISLIALLFVAAACTSSTDTASVNPETTPSASATATPSETTVPSASPSAPPSAPPAVAIAALPVHNAEVGVGYLAVTFAAKNGLPPYTWSVGSGQVPPGLSLSAGGVLSGKNTTAGTYNFVAKVTDSNGGTATGKVKIIVFAPFTVTSFCAKGCNVGAGCTACGTFGKISGGAGPYTYRLVSGIPPGGMSWNRALALTGAFPPPPPPNLAAGPPPPPVPFTVQVTDGFAVTRSATAYWNIFPAVNFIWNSAGSPGAGCYTGTGTTTNCSDSSLTYSLGNPADKISVLVVKACYDNPNATYICSDDPGAAPLASYIPPGWKATASGGVATVGMDCGNPELCSAKTGYTGWFGDVFIVLVDKGACVAPTAMQSALTADVNIDI